MQIRHIVAATDESEAGRQAVWTAVELAASAGARVTVLRAVQFEAAVDEQAPDILVLGCHRGGPAGIMEAGSTSRRLTHTAPCAVLTVPL
jgi:nucleotide-binding universal stress UspA family protein